MAGQYFRNQRRGGQPPQMPSHAPPQHYESPQYQEEHFEQEPDYDYGYDQNYQQSYDPQYREMSPIEIRLAKANCYRMLLESNLFMDGDYVSQEVEAEVREFIEEKLSQLMGFTPEPQKVESFFSDEEIDVLKRLAEKMLSKPTEEKPPSNPQRTNSRPSTAKPRTQSNVKRNNVRKTSKNPPRKTAPKPRPQAVGPRPTAPLTARAPVSSAVRDPGGRSHSKKTILVTNNEGNDVEVDITPQRVSKWIKPVPMASVEFANRLALQQAAMLENDVNSMAVRADEGIHSNYK